MTAPSSDCKIVDFMNEKVRDYKPTEGHGYYQFTKKEHIPPDAEVVLMDKVSITILWCKIIYLLISNIRISELSKHFNLYP